MVEELSEFSAGQFETVSQLLASSVSLQMALAVLVVGLIIIVTVYRKFSSWIQTQNLVIRAHIYPDLLVPQCWPFLQLD